MEWEHNKTTVPDPSAATDGEQPSGKNPTASIADEPEKNKTDEEIMREHLRELQWITRMSDPSYLHTVSMNDLYDTVYESRPPIIDGLLYAGTYLFAGAPKIGKSFLMAQLAFHVSAGLPLWGYEVHQGTVLYLALEDNHQRLQSRMYRMFGTNGSEKLHFATFARHLDEGLEDQLRHFVESYPDTRLIIIDTLQKIREVGSDKYSYGSDYEIIAKLKRFADARGLCLLLVHHTRKQPASDRFDMISGTNGLMGAADGAFLLEKENRTSVNATLDVSGRDQQDQRLFLVKNRERLTWELDHVETELWKAPPDQILEAVAKLVTENSPEWIGSPTELAAILKAELPANALTKHLNVNASRLRDEYGIGYENKARHEGRRIRFLFQNTEAVR